MIGEFLKIFSGSAKIQGNTDKKEFNNVLREHLAQYNTDQRNCIDRNFWATVTFLSEFEALDREESDFDLTLGTRFGRLFRTINVGHCRNDDGEFSKPVLIIRNPKVYLGYGGGDSDKVAHWIIGSGNKVQTVIQTPDSLFAIFQNQKKSVALKTGKISDCWAEFSLLVE